MADPERLDLDPVTLAEHAAIDVFHSRDATERNSVDTARLVALDQTASVFDFINQTYWVEATRGVSIPIEFDRDEEVDIIDFHKLIFEGKFACYSRVVVGKVTSRYRNSRVSALCLAFTDTTLLPYMDGLPDDHILHVPVLAVDEISPTQRPESTDVMQN